MTPEEREALLAGYALGTLSEPDARDAERLIRTDEEAAAEYRAYSEIADLIALSVPLRQAEPRLRERVIEAARRGGLTWRTPARWRRNLPAIGLAAALAAVTVWAVSLQTSLHMLREDTRALAAIVESDAKRLDAIDRAAASVLQAESLGVQLETALRDQQALIAAQADPEALRIEFQQTNAAHGATGEYVWSAANDTSLVLLQTLPPLPVGATYMVVIEDNLGRFNTAASFVPDLSGFAQIVLDVEAGVSPVRAFVIASSGGSAEGPVVLQANVRETPPLE
ncbi:MAG: hypothetical protein AMXMBFR23_18150 [Chloroflexota bacterium]